MQRARGHHLQIFLLALMVLSQAVFPPMIAVGASRMAAVGESAPPGPTFWVPRYLQEDDLIRPPQRQHTRIDMRAQLHLRSAVQPAPDRGENRMVRWRPHVPVRRLLHRTAPHSSGSTQPA